jgi:hypothetical protein
MLKVFKYDVPIADSFKLTLPKHAKVLSFQAQRDRPQIWALVDPEEATMEREYRLAGTGHPIEDRENDLHYIGSCQIKDGFLVWHLFEVIRF